MTSSTVFTSNRSQAVRLPKAVAFPEDVHQVDILKIGRSRVIVPQGKRWDDLFAAWLGGLPDQPPGAIAAVFYLLYAPVRASSISRSATRRTCRPAAATAALERRVCSASSAISPTTPSNLAGDEAATTRLVAVLDTAWGALIGALVAGGTMAIAVLNWLGWSSRVDGASHVLSDFEARRLTPVMRYMPSGCSSSV